MKIIHLSDLHIGIRLHNYDLKEEQCHVFRQIIEYARKEQPDAVVIAGDIYDKSVPSAEAVDLFDEFITDLRSVRADMPVMVISGNHDSAQRLDCFRNILKDENIYMVGIPPEKKGEHIECVTLCDEFGPVHFYLLPFVKPAFVRNIVGENVTSYDEAVHLLLEQEEINQQERNVLVSHQFFVKDKESAGEIERAETEVYTVGNIDSITTDCLEPFDYVALGHIHKPMKAGRETIRYCGTPMAYSLSEEGQQKGILMVTLGEKEKEPEIQTIPLNPLRKIRTERGSLEEVLAVPSDDYVWVSLTDKTDMDISDMQIRLWEAFPHLLGVRNENTMDLAVEDLQWEQLQREDAFDLFMKFCKDLNEEEQEIIKDVIHTVKGVM